MHTVIVLLLLLLPSKPLLVENGIIATMKVSQRRDRQERKLYNFTMKFISKYSEKNNYYDCSIFQIS